MRPETVETTLLKPLQKLTPLKLTPPAQDSADDEETDFEEE